MENTGTVEEVTPVSTYVSGVSVSSATSDTVGSLPWLVIAAVILSCAALCGGLWYLRRRRNEGFDLAFEAC